MKYQKLKLEFKYGPKGRFYRVVLVRKGLTLRTLGCYLVEALGGELEHMFLYKDKNNHYEDETWFGNFLFMHTRIKEFDYTKYTLDDLSQHFYFFMTLVMDMILNVQDIKKKLKWMMKNIQINLLLS